MRVNSLEFNQSIVNSLKRAQRAVSAANPRLNEIRLLGGLGHRCLETWPTLYKEA